MKKQMIATAVALTLGSVSMTANAAPASGTLTWFGLVNSIFNSSEIALTGQGGSKTIYPAYLQIDNTDGSFKTALNGITVEAYDAIDDDGDGIFEADTTVPYPDTIAWTLDNANVSTSADGDYDATALEFTINNFVATPGDPVTEVEDDNVITVKVSSGPAVETPTAGVVLVSAVIYAEPTGGIVPGNI